MSARDVRLDQQRDLLLRIGGDGDRLGNAVELEVAQILLLGGHGVDHVIGDDRFEIGAGACGCR